jgi:hypothetical protein
MIINTKYFIVYTILIFLLEYILLTPTFLWHLGNQEAKYTIKFSSNYGHRNATTRKLILFKLQ